MSLRPDPRFILGSVFAAWTVIGESQPEQPRYVSCRCRCGVEKLLYKTNLTSGLSKSCGCESRIGRPPSIMLDANGKRTPEYAAWSNAMSRCYNRNNEWYHRYGGRGICMCPAWLASFAQFLEDMGPRPPGTSIDRRDNDGDYAPENCSWATHQEQVRNRTTVQLITYQGKTLSVAEWARLKGMSSSALRRRLSRPGLALDEILGVPFKPRAGLHPPVTASSSM